MSTTTDTQSTEETKPETTQTPAAPEAEKRFTQAELDKIVQERLDRAEKKRKTDADKAAEEARQKALAESGDVAKLAEERAKLLADRDKEIAELRGKIEAGDKATAAVAKLLETQLADVPEHIKALLANMSAPDQLEWLAANKAKLAGDKATEQPADKQTKRVPATKAPDAERAISESEADKKRQSFGAQVRGMYS